MSPLVSALTYISHFRYGSLMSCVTIKI